jgi:hypothetical protein
MSLHDGRYVVMGGYVLDALKMVMKDSVHISPAHGMPAILCYLPSALPGICPSCLLDMCAAQLSYSMKHLIGFQQQWCECGHLWMHNPSPELGPCFAC